MLIGKIDVTNDKVIEDSIVSNKESYNVDDCCLVRTTDHFPFGGKIYTPLNAYALNREYPSGFKYILLDLLKERKDKREILKRFEIFNRSRRNTVHFSINGLVGNHEYGDFSSRNFIILEPLKYHINSNSLLSLRVEDTYFNDNINLSKDAVIIIKEDVYNIIKNDISFEDELQKYRIYTYKGDNETKVVSSVLNELGYDAFVVSSHGYTNGTDSKSKSNKMYEFISNYASSNSIPQEPHFNSKNKYNVLKEEQDSISEITNRIIDIMAMHLNKSKEEVDFLHEIIDDVLFVREYEEYLKNFISEYGLDNLANLISRINIETLTQVKEEKIVNHCNQL